MFKFTTRKGYSGSIKKVWNADKTKQYGVIGTVADLLAEGIFEYCDAEPTAWAFIDMDCNASFFNHMDDALLERLV